MSQYLDPMLRLASGSPRRVELLGLLGVRVTVEAPDLDESAFADPASAKALAVHRSGEVTLGADTLVYLDGEAIGKPRDLAHARELLLRLAGRTHVVRTVVVLLGAAGQRLRFAVSSRVRTAARDDVAIDAYVATGEPLGKAGAYAIQGAGAALITGYEGCFSNIVGLPLCHTYFALRKLGVVTAELPEPAFERRFGFTCPAYPRAYAEGRMLCHGAELGPG